MRSFPLRKQLFLNNEGELPHYAIKQRIEKLFELVAFTVKKIFLILDKTA
jgi:hypothetical protein